MGAGNYLPHLQDYEMIYVNYPTFGDEDNYEFQSWLEGLRMDISCIASKSLSENIRRESDRIVFLANDLIEVSHADNQWGMAIVVSPVLDRETNLPTFPNLYKRSMLAAMRNIKRGLLRDDYEIYVRTGPWTSGKITSDG